MKVACALVCLALAQGISASIFKRAHRPNINVQPLEYINQYQQPMYQPPEYTYQDYIKQLKQQLKKQQKQQHSSSSSQENSQQDSTEWSNVRKYVSIRPSNQKWDKPMFTAVMKIQNDVLEATPYGQKTVWSRVSEMPGTQTNQQQEQEQQWQQQQGQQQQWQQQQVQKTQGQQQQEQQQQGQQQKQPLMPNAAQQQEIEQIFAAAQKTMNHPTAEDKLQYQQALQEAAQVHNEDDHLNATQLLQKYDYAVEEHTVKTEDGYVLTLFRIPPKKVLVRDVSKKPVVFLMHGLLGSADDWLLMGPGKSLGYLLSDAGYDVWLGNARGNKYSHSHVSKHPALNDFWQFSNDEIAIHDVPAMINYTLETSGQEKLNYIGHSQGATVFFGLTASKPEYNDKIIKMYALAPMVYMQHARSPLIRMIAPKSQLGKSIHHEIGHGEFKPAKELIATVGGQMLYSEIGAKNLSSNVNVVMAGVNIENLKPEMVPVILGHLPAGTSSRVIKQYGQQVSGGDFRKYDFGPAINQQVYESELPPKYPLENVKVPVTIYYAEEDWLASPVDVTRLQEELPSSVNAYKVQEPHFSHLDFQFSTKAPQLVYKQLIDSMTN